jgi:hypothetical protein
VITVIVIVSARHSTTPQIKTAIITPTITPHLEKRVAGYSLLSNGNIMIVSTLSNEFQEISSNGSIIKSYPGDFYVNPRFVWSPNKTKVAIIQKTLDPNSTIPIVVYDFITKTSNQIADNIITVSWKNDQELFAQRSTSGKPGIEIALIDPNGKEKEKLYSTSESLKLLEVYETSASRLLAIFEQPDNDRGRGGRFYLLETLKKELQGLFRGEVKSIAPSPNKNLFALTTTNEQGNISRSLLYQVDSKKIQQLPFSARLLYWINNQTLLGVTSKGELLGEKLEQYHLDNKTNQTIVESTEDLPLQFNDIQFDQTNKIIYFVWNEFIYKIQL